MKYTNRQTENLQTDLMLIVLLFVSSVVQNLAVAAAGGFAALNICSGRISAFLAISHVYTVALVIISPQRRPLTLLIASMHFSSCFPEL